MPVPLGPRNRVQSAAGPDEGATTRTGNASNSTRRIDASGCRGSGSDVDTDTVTGDSGRGHSDWRTRLPGEFGWDSMTPALSSRYSPPRLADAFPEGGMNTTGSIRLTKLAKRA